LGGKFDHGIFHNPPDLSIEFNLSAGFELALSIIFLSMEIASRGTLTRIWKKERVKLRCVSL
jgi:hypothetical protein